MKVFYLANWYNSIYNDIFNHLDEDIEITMILSEKFPSFKENNYPVKILPTKDIGEILYFFKKNQENFLLFYSKKLRQYIEEEKPDVVIANLVYLPSTYQVSKICKN